MNQLFYKYIIPIVCALAIFFFGIFLGLIYNSQSQNLALWEIEIPEKKVLATLEITQVSPLGIKGKVKGAFIRISNGKEVLEVLENENFQLPISSLYKDISFVVPPLAKFFASKKGKKYYSVKNTKQLSKMSPKNLLFFNNELDAKNAGYKD